MKKFPLLINLMLILSPILISLALFTFVYAKGWSYLTNDPSACANCHVMNSYYEGWEKSSHRSVAVCNDCHAPSSILPKYYTKASNGFWHSYAFTLNNYPENIRIKEGNYEISQKACLKCHSEITESISNHSKGVTDCSRCHGAIGHPKK
ncbi:MAG: cytochrome c nitrite reductase small subunit [Leptospiraceae bacterium]|nr:cytochrome c nitrite reductase small subunit [Leptospiraceae bacterium]